MSTIRQNTPFETAEEKKIFWETSSQIMAQALLRQIVIQLARLYRQQAAPAPAAGSAMGKTRAETVFVLEEAFLFHYRTLTLPDLASLMNLSVRQTQRLLQRHFGKTFSQKLSEARMAAASQFLITTDLSITEISERVGFNTMRTFNRAFSKQMGMTPREYRASHAIRMNA